MKHIHLISRQVGTAYPFVEFYKLFVANGYLVKNYIYASSIGPYQKANIPYEIISCFDEYLKLTDDDPCIIMTGTSLEVDDDTRYWIHANTKSCASIAWVDQPINLSERFSFGRPNIVLANDQHTLNHLFGIGMVEDCICFGSPYLHALSKKIKRNSLKNKTLYFASEPYFENRSDYLVRSKSPNRIKYGFDDVDALIYAHKLLTQNQTMTGEFWNILVRPHPCDNIIRLNEAFSQSSGRAARLTFTDLEKEEILEVAPIVMGMRSMFLFEAASLGIPTISLQPGQKISWPFMDSHTSILALYGEPNDSHKFTARLSNLKDHQPRIDYDEKKVLNFIEQLGALREKKVSLYN